MHTKEGKMTKEQEYNNLLDKACDEQLGYEWCDRGGCEWEFNSLMERYGREFIVERLYDQFEVKSAINLEIIR